ncbi:oxamate carbamoyltransferase subunit AllH family protein [Enterococcus sp. LJL128]
MWKTKAVAGQNAVDLKRFGRMGKIHSVFEHSFNLLISNRLIHVSAFTEYLSSFGIQIPVKLFEEIQPYIQQGNIVKIIENGFRIYSCYGVGTVEFSQLQIISLNVLGQNFSMEHLKLLKNKLEKLRLADALGLPLNKEEQEIFYSLSSMPKTAASVDFKKSVSYLAGRGKGLTPSGDDILTAYLSVLHWAGDQRAEALSSALTHPLPSTTDVSKAYILEAAEGNVNSFIYQLFSDLENRRTAASIDEAIKKIRSIGHTSGNDLCFGLLLGAQAVINDKL